MICKECINKAEVMNCYGEPFCRKCFNDLENEQDTCIIQEDVES